MRPVFANLNLKVDQKKNKAVKPNKPLLNLKISIFKNQNDHKLLTEKRNRFP